MSKEQYLNKPVPEEAEDTQQFYAGEKIFRLGLWRLLVNDKKIVTFAYNVDEKTQAEDTR